MQSERAAKHGSALCRIPRPRPIRSRLPVGDGVLDIPRSTRQGIYFTYGEFAARLRIRLGFCRNAAIAAGAPGSARPTGLRLRIRRTFGEKRAAAAGASGTPPPTWSISRCKAPIYRRVLPFAGKNGLTRFPFSWHLKKPRCTAPCVSCQSPASVLNCEKLSNRRNHLCPLPPLLSWPPVWAAALAD